jgi:muramidase (phage lysozyme)
MADNKNQIEIQLGLNLEELKKNLAEAEALMKQGAEAIARGGQAPNIAQTLLAPTAQGGVPDNGLPPISIGQNSEQETAVQPQGQANFPGVPAGLLPPIAPDIPTTAPTTIPDVPDPKGASEPQHEVPPAAAVPPIAPNIPEPSNAPPAQAPTPNQPAIDPLAKAWQEFEKIQGYAEKAPDIAAHAGKGLEQQILREGSKNPDDAHEWQELLQGIRDLTRSLKDKHQQEKDKGDSGGGETQSLMHFLRLGAIAQTAGTVASEVQGGNFLGAAGTIIGGGLGLIGGPAGAGIGAAIGGGLGSAVQGGLDSANQARYFQIQQSEVASRFGNFDNLNALGIDSIASGEHSGYKPQETLNLVDSLRQSHVIDNATDDKNRELIESIQALTRATGMSSDAMTKLYSSYKTTGGEEDPKAYMAQVVGGAIDSGMSQHLQEYGELLGSARSQIVQRSGRSDENDEGMKRIQSTLAMLVGGGSSTAGLLRDNPLMAQQAIGGFLASGAAAQPYSSDSISLQLAGVDRGKTDAAYTTPEQQAENASKRMEMLLQNTLLSPAGLSTLGMSKEQLAAKTKDDPNFLSNVVSSANPNSAQAAQLQDLININYRGEYGRNPNASDIQTLTQLGTVASQNNGQIPLNATTNGGQTVQSLLTDSKKTEGQTALDLMAAHETEMLKLLDRFTPLLNELDKNINSLIAGTTQVVDKLTQTITGIDSFGGDVNNLGSLITNVSGAIGGFTSSVGDFSSRFGEETEKFIGGAIDLGKSIDATVKNAIDALVDMIPGARNFSQNTPEAQTGFASIPYGSGAAALTAVGGNGTLNIADQLVQSAGGSSNSGSDKDSAALSIGRSLAGGLGAATGQPPQTNDKGEVSGDSTAATDLSPRMRAFLDTIAYSEGTSGDEGYNTTFGYHHFDSYADHPRELVSSGGYSSDAAGRYQFLSTTWDGLGLKDFSPANQDRGAAELLRNRGVADEVEAGNWQAAIANGANNEWASLPGSPYGQPTRSMEELQKVYEQALAKYQNVHDRFNDTPPEGVIARPDYRIFEFAPGDRVHAKQTNGVHDSFGDTPPGGVVARPDYRVFEFAPGDRVHATQSPDAPELDPTSSLDDVVRSLLLDTGKLLGADPNLGDRFENKDSERKSVDFNPESERSQKRYDFGMSDEAVIPKAIDLDKEEEPRRHGRIRAQRQGEDTFTYLKQRHVFGRNDVDANQPSHSEVGDDAIAQILKPAKFTDFAKPDKSLSRITKPPKAIAQPLDDLYQSANSFLSTATPLDDLAQSASSFFGESPIAGENPGLALQGSAAAIASTPESATPLDDLFKQTDSFFGSPASTAVAPNAAPIAPTSQLLTPDPGSTESSSPIAGGLEETNSLLSQLLGQVKAIAQKMGISVAAPAAPASVAPAPESPSAPAAAAIPAPVANPATIDPAAVRSAGKGATTTPGQPAADGAIASGLYTSPTEYNGGSAEYHVDNKFSRDLSWQETTHLFDQMAAKYREEGRKIEFSNEAVAGEVYDETADEAVKEKLLQRAFGAHHSQERDINNGVRSVDYYIPKREDDRYAASAENAQQMLPAIAGANYDYGTGGGYGNFVYITDANGKMIMESGHGNSTRELPQDMTLPTNLATAISQTAPSSVSPAVAQAPRSPAQPNPQLNLFGGGSQSLAARIIGMSEGTRTADGGFTDAFQGHTDPGNGAHNMGSFSYQHGASTPEEADRAELEVLQSQYKNYEKAASAAGLDPNDPRLAMNFLDLYVQAPLAATGEGGFLDQLPTIAKQGISDESILSARIESYKDPSTGQFDAPGLGNDLGQITHDQQRRMDRVKDGIKANNLTSATTAQPQSAPDAPASAAIPQVGVGAASAIAALSPNATAAEIKAAINHDVAAQQDQSTAAAQPTAIAQSLTVPAPAPTIPEAIAPSAPDRDPSSVLSQILGAVQGIANWLMGGKPGAASPDSAAAIATTSSANPAIAASSPESQQSIDRLLPPNPGQVAEMMPDILNEFSFGDTSAAPTTGIPDLSGAADIIANSTPDAQTGGTLPTGDGAIEKLMPDLLSEFNFDAIEAPSPAAQVPDLSGAASIIANSEPGGTLPAEDGAIAGLMPDILSEFNFEDGTTQDFAENRKTLEKIFNLPNVEKPGESLDSIEEFFRDDKAGDKAIAPDYSDKTLDGLLVPAPLALSEPKSLKDSIAPAPLAIDIDKAEKNSTDLTRLPFEEFFPDRPVQDDRDTFTKLKQSRFDIAANRVNQPEFDVLRSLGDVALEGGRSPKSLEGLMIPAPLASGKDAPEKNAPQEALKSLEGLAVPAPLAIAPSLGLSTLEKPEKPDLGSLINLPFEEFFKAEPQRDDRDTFTKFKQSRFDIAANRESDRFAFPVQAAPDVANPGISRSLIEKLPDLPASDGKEVGFDGGRSGGSAPPVTITINLEVPKAAGYEWTKNAAMEGAIAAHDEFLERWEKGVLDPRNKPRWRTTIH